MWTVQGRINTIQKTLPATTLHRKPPMITMVLDPIILLQRIRHVVILKKRENGVVLKKRENGITHIKMTNKTTKDGPKTTTMHQGLKHNNVVESKIAIAITIACCNYFENGVLQRLI